LQHGVDRRRRRCRRIERRGRVPERDLLAVVPEPAGAEIAVPFDIEPLRPLQYDLLGGGELQLLPRGQDMVESDVGVEGETVRCAEIGAGLLQQPTGRRRQHRRPAGSRRLRLRFRLRQRRTG
jgi:hypothetical protein